MLAVPLSGWRLDSVAGRPLPWVGLFDICAVAGRNPDLHKPVDAVHACRSWTRVARVALRVAVVALRQRVLRDGTLARMLPGR